MTVFTRKRQIPIVIGIMIIVLIIIYIIGTCFPNRNSDSDEIYKIKDNPIEITYDNKNLTNIGGTSIMQRFETPGGFNRIEVATDSYGQYLRTLPLKQHGVPVMIYDGREKSGDVHEAVVDIDVGKRDLQQCADAVMRLWAEYHYLKKEYAKIHFNFTNGFSADYEKWRKGYRIEVNGNNAVWVGTTKESTSYQSFRQYLDMVFSYAGTLSLSKEMKNIPLEEMQIGDIFLKGEDPGHCVIVLDMAEHPVTKKKLFILAQSYMPAQDIHILKNKGNSKISPWYELEFGEKLYTPEWTFTKNQLYRFKE